MSNNTSIIGTCGSIGTQGLIGTCGSIGTTGSVGYQGYMTDWKEDMMKKYPRFNIKTDYDTMSFAPTNIITDTRTNKEYEFKPNNISDIMNETDKFIQGLIIEIRDEKLNTLINGSES